jgi:hypothetical protein
MNKFFSKKIKKVLDIGKRKQYNVEKGREAKWHMPFFVIRLQANYETP